MVVGEHGLPHKQNAAYCDVRHQEISSWGHIAKAKVTSRIIFWHEIDDCDKNIARQNQFSLHMAVICTQNLSTGDCGFAIWKKNWRSANVMVGRHRMIALYCKLWYDEQHCNGGALRYMCVYQMGHESGQLRNTWDDTPVGQFGYGGPTVDLNSFWKPKDVNSQSAMKLLILLNSCQKAQ